MYKTLFAWSLGCGAWLHGRRPQGHGRVDDLQELRLRRGALLAGEHLDKHGERVQRGDALRSLK